jgi:hypothetical protein
MEEKPGMFRSWKDAATALLLISLVGLSFWALLFWALLSIFGR